jgi:hypothetical protein
MRPYTFIGVQIRSIWRKILNHQTSEGRFYYFLDFDALVRLMTIPYYDNRTCDMSQEMNKEALTYDCVDSTINYKEQQLIPGCYG